VIVSSLNLTSNLGQIPKLIISLKILSDTLKIIIRESATRGSRLREGLVIFQSTAGDQVSENHGGKSHFPAQVQKIAVASIVELDWLNLLYLCQSSMKPSLRIQKGATSDL